jgi:hypothetical protein
MPPLKRIHNITGEKLDDDAIEFIKQPEGWLHNEGGRPCIMSTSLIECRVMGVLHHDNGPARVTDELTAEWYNNGRLHSQGWYFAKALVTPQEQLFEWYSDGLLNSHEDYPARIHLKGTTVLCEWYRNGLQHRDRYPAYLLYDGQILKEFRFYSGGQLHHDEHVAVGVRQDDGSYRGEYWLHGQRYTAEEFRRARSIVRRRVTVEEDKEVNIVD